MDNKHKKVIMISRKEDMQVGKIKPLHSYKVLTNDYAGLSKDITVTFRITEACDLKCNYCHWHSGRHYDYNDIINSIDKLFEYFIKQKFKTVNFYYHGGEATRHPKVVDILKYIKDKSKETGIIAYNEMQTNLTIQEEKLRAMLPYCDQFNVSYHYLELLVRNKLNAFDRNWDVLKELGVRLHNFDIMLENVERDHKYYAGRQIEINADDFYERVLKYLKYENIENSEMIYGFCHYDYPEEIANKHMQFYKEHNKTQQKYLIDDVEYNTNDLFREGIDARGWHCSAGTQSLTINGDGNVFHCGIHMTTHLRKCTPETPYTNLIHDKLALTKLSILHKTGTICRWDYCGGDFYLKRTKPKT